MFELGKNGTPGGLDGALKMDGLHAHQLQSSPSREQASRARTCREVNVLLQGEAQPGFLIRIDFDESHEIAVKHIVGLSAQDIRQPAGHAGAEIQAERPEDDGYAGGHVLATVLADALDYGKRTAVPDSEALSGTASNKKLARGSAIENGVAGKNVTAPRSGEPRGDGDGSAGETLSDIVVGFALELEGDALGKKCAEALARRTVKILLDLFIAGKAVLAAAHQFPAQAGANAAVGILNGLRLILEPECGMKMK